MTKLKNQSEKETSKGDIFFENKSKGVSVVLLIFFYDCVLLKNKIKIINGTSCSKR
jgi:hypothetical protein